MSTQQLPPKFLWKGYSEKLCGNISFAYSGEAKDSTGTLCAKVGVVVFEASGVKELASFTAFIPSDQFLELVHAGEVVTKLEEVAYEFFVTDAEEYRADVKPSIH